MLLSKEDLKIEEKQKRTTHQLPEDCDSQVTLYSSSEITAAAILTPGVGVAMNYHTLKRIACALVKDINYTPQALTALGTEMTWIREAALEN